MVCSEAFACGVEGQKPLKMQKAKLEAGGVVLRIFRLVPPDDTFKYLNCQFELDSTSVPYPLMAGRLRFETSSQVSHVLENKVRINKWLGASTQRESKQQSLYHNIAIQMKNVFQGMAD